MKRLWMGLALTPLLLLPACGDGGGTYVKLNLQQGDAPAQVTRIELDIMLGASRLMPPLEVRGPGGGEVSFPASKVLEIRHGEGAFTVNATAFDSAGNAVITGSAGGTVTRGNTLELTLRFGTNLLSDGGLPDGGDNVVLEVSPTDQNFGNQVVGVTSPPVTFTFTNLGPGTSPPLTPSFAGTGASSFSISTNACSQALARAASCTIDVVFRPQSAGSLTALLNVANAPSVSVRGTGEAAGALTVAPTSHGFGGLPVNGASAPQTFTITNTDSGVTSGVLAARLTGSNPTDFMLEADGCTGVTLAPSATCTVALRFQPTQGGNKLASLLVTGAPGGTAVASVTGNGQRPARLVVSPSTVDFGTALLGTPSAPTTLTFRNDGDLATGTPTTVAPGTDFVVMANMCTGSLAGGASCTMAVRFNPATRGAKMGTLALSATPGSMASVDLSGVAQRPATLIVDPLTGGFGTVTIGNTATVSFTLSNIGEVASGPPSATLSGTDIGQYAVTSNTCMGLAMLAANASCSVQVTFTPTAPAGSKVATLTLAATPGGSLMAPLAGTSATPGALTMAPGAHDFGGTAVGSGSTGFNFVVTNTGGTSSGTLSTTLSGGASSDFNVVSDTCNGMTLAPAGTCTVNLRFSPTGAGGKTETLVVGGMPGGMATASLTGSGLAPPLLAISPTTQAFASTLTGSTSASQSFTVTNTGGVVSGTVSAALTGGNSNQWAIGTSTCTAALMPGATCMVALTFRPTSPGVKSASLDVSASPGGTTRAALSATGLAPAALTVTPTSFGFGSVLVGSSSTAQQFTVRNTGDVATSALSTSVMGPFAVAGASGCTAALAPGATCMVSVQFVPAARGAATGGNLLVSDGTATAMASLSGTGIDAVLTISPSSADFNSVILGASATQTITITNSGDAVSGAVTLAVSGTHASDFVLSGGSCVSGSTTLGPGISCTKVMTFMPGMLGARSGTLTASATPGATAMAGLAGMGIGVGAITMSPATQNFGSVQVGQNSTAQAFTVTNTGGASTGTLSVTLSAPFNVVSNGCTGMALPGGGGNCTITARFSPTARGSASGPLRVTDGSLMAESSLSGLGIGAVLALAPAPFQFPAVGVGTGTTRTFTVSNNGDATSSALTLSVAGGNATDFSLSGGTCVNGTTTLAAGASCTKVVTFTPGMAGGRTTTLTASATSGGSATSALSGVGMAPAALSVSPTSHDYGSEIVGNTTAPFSYTFTNVGEVDTGVLSASVTGQFAIASNGCAGVSLGSAATCVVTARFAPTSTGLKNGSLQVGDGSITVAASLSATGTMPVLAVSPTSKNYGTVAVSGGSASQMFTVTNTGNGQSGPIIMNISGDYAIGGGTCTLAVTELPPGGSCTKSVLFDPAVVGTRTGTLTVSATPGNSVPVMLTGVGN